MRLPPSLRMVAAQPLAEVFAHERMNVEGFIDDGLVTGRQQSKIAERRDRLIPGRLRQTVEPFGEPGHRRLGLQHGHLAFPCALVEKAQHPQDGELWLSSEPAFVSGHHPVGGLALERRIAIAPADVPLESTRDVVSEKR